MKIAICDNEEIIIFKLKELLMNIAAKIGIKLDISIFYCGEDLWERISRAEFFDIIYLDIEMEADEMNGIETALKIKKVNWAIEIIFVTGFDIYMKAAFDVKPFRFISKPIDEQEFKKVFEIISNYIIESKYEKFEFQLNGRYCSLLLSNIVYFETNKRTVKIKTVDNEYFFYGKIESVMESVKTSSIQFIQIRKHCLVNFKYVIEYSYGYVVLMDEIILNISKEWRANVRKEYIRRRKNE